ncbi:MAG: cell division protein ZapA [Gammaproteobacteria bacterium]
MTKNTAETTIEILGKSYQIKCPDTELSSLQRAACYLEEKMRDLHDANNGFNVDRIAIIAALNVVHQLLTFENQKETHLGNINQRLHDLQNKIEHALMPTVQMELQPAE